MGSRDLFIFLYVRLENALSRGDFQVREPSQRGSRTARNPAPAMPSSAHAETFFAAVADLAGNRPVPG
jgi:hypothetical protein